MLSVDEMNQRFGAPGRIVFRTGFAGYPNVVLANKFGTAEVALLGANVLSYRPTGQMEVLFRPDGRDDAYNRCDNFHGGIPVCWPQFGNRFSKEIPQHGFARKLVFTVEGTEYSEEMTEVTLELVSDAATRELWPHDFKLEVKISVSMKLNLTMTTTNTGKSPFSFSCGYHPYFRVRNRDLVTVRGLDGCAYVDASGAEIKEGVLHGDLKADFAPDHIFSMPPRAKHEYALIDPGLRRAIAIASSANHNAVVWNPGTAYVVDGHTKNDWPKYLCVEPVSDWPGGAVLAAGETATLAASIQSVLEPST